MTFSDLLSSFRGFLDAREAEPNTSNNDDQRQDDGLQYTYATVVGDRSDGEREDSSASATDGHGEANRTDTEPLKNKFAFRSCWT